MAHAGPYLSCLPSDGASEILTFEVIAFCRRQFGREARRGSGSAPATDNRTCSQLFAMALRLSRLLRLQDAASRTGPQKRAFQFCEDPTSIWKRALNSSALATGGPATKARGDCGGSVLDEEARGAWGLDGLPACG